MRPTYDVSIIIYHHYNMREEELLKTVHSYLNQQIKGIDNKLEIILVLDGVKLKQLPSIQEEIQKEKVFFTVIEEEGTFIGPGKMWNRAFEVSKGAKIVFSWTGINWLSDSLYSLDHLLQETKAKAVCGSAIYKRIIKNEIKEIKVLGEKNLSIDFLGFSNSMLLSYTLITRETIEELGGFCEDKEHTQIVDWEFMMRLIYNFKVEALEGKRIIISNRLGDNDYRYPFKYSLDEEIRYFMNRVAIYCNPLKQPIGKKTLLNQITIPANKSLKIAFITGLLENAQVQLKLLNYLENKLLCTKVTWRRFVELETKGEDIKDYDVVIFIRSKSNEALKIAQYCYQNKIKTAYILDDNWFCIGKEYPEFERELGIESLKYKNFIRLITSVNCVLVYNDIIYKEANKYNSNVAELPISINLDYFSDKKPKKDGIWIGFAGSQSKERYFSAAFKALEKIMKEFNEVHLYIKGIAYPKSLESFKNRIIQTRYQYDYKQYVKEMSEYPCDIMISPIDEDCYTNGKCAYKYLEYTAIGAVGIYNPTKVVNKVIKDGYNGILIDNTEEEWYKALRKLISDVTLREYMITNAKQDVKTNYDSCKVMNYFIKMLEELTEKNLLP